MKIKGLLMALKPKVIDAEMKKLNALSDMLAGHINKEGLKMTGDNMLLVDCALCVEYARYSVAWASGKWKGGMMQRPSTNLEKKIKGLLPNQRLALTRRAE